LDAGAWAQQDLDGEAMIHSDDVSLDERPVIDQRPCTAQIFIGLLGRVRR
jgi:hypothetical protein